MPIEGGRQCITHKTRQGDTGRVHDGKFAQFCGANETRGQHRHHQHGHQVERGHGHDQREDDEHHAFFKLHGGEPGAVLARPVAQQHAAGDHGAELVHHAAGPVQVLELQADARGAFEPKDQRRIVDVHFPTLKADLLAVAMKTFYDVRHLPGLKKKPSTSELLDWLKLLVAEDIPLEALQSGDNKVAVPPLIGALLKNEQDVSLFEKLVLMNQRNR